jgi:nitroreductase
MIGTHRNPRKVSELDFPAFGSAEEKLRFLIHYAVLAPSGHNTQPWLFDVAGGALTLHADRSRTLPVVDPADRALTMSCGAALLYLRLALRHYGYAGEVETLPDPDAPGLLARVRLGPPREPTLAEERLFKGMLTRRTNRQAYEDRPVPESSVRALRRAVQGEGATLHLVRSPERKEDVAALIAKGDRRQMKDKAFRRELAAWIRKGDGPSRDGMPAYAFGLSKRVDFMTPVAAFVLRRFDMGKGQAAKDYELATGSPLLAVLATGGDTPSDWLQAGQALGRLLLQVEALGLSASFLNQPIEEAALRPRLRSLLGAEDIPQVLLRVGVGPDVSAPTPRRPVSEVLRSRNGSRTK